MRNQRIATPDGEYPLDDVRQQQAEILASVIYATRVMVQTPDLDKALEVYYEHTQESGADAVVGEFAAVMRHFSNPADEYTAPALSGLQRELIKELQTSVREMARGKQLENSMAIKVSAMEQSNGRGNGQQR